MRAHWATARGSRASQVRLWSWRFFSCPEGDVAQISQLLCAPVAPGIMPLAFSGGIRLESHPHPHFSRSPFLDPLSLPSWNSALPFDNAYRPKPV